MYRFGITMRITNAVGYDEPRDTIASDWNEYMLSAFPDSQFIYIPNIEKNVAAYIDELNINVLILSGGDDLGVYPRRDITETLALEHAIKKQIPVIAICRGLQLVHTYFGGKLEVGSEKVIKEHRATKHLINIESFVREVNSYHTNYLNEESVSDKFEIFARCKSDNSVEGIRNKNILAMMWHPERDVEIVEWNRLLIEKFLKSEN